MSLPPSLSQLRRRVAEAFGIGRYSWPALNDLDRKLVNVLGSEKGFFIEAGANDGYAQSNTYYLERMRGWTGILIEPIPELCGRCRRERPRSVVVQAALVGPGAAGREVEMYYAGLMSVAQGAFGDEGGRRRHLETGLKQHGVHGTYTIKVPAKTLSEIIDEQIPEREIDLISLDVEGSELAALSGLDLTRHVPCNLLIEVRPAARMEILNRLVDRYASPVVLFDAGTHQDLLFTRR